MFPVGIDHFGNGEVAAALRRLQLPAVGEPFGNEAVVLVAAFLAAVAAQQMIFAAEGDDGLAGLFVKAVRGNLWYHFRHRDHSPTLGRWMQQDPMGYVDGMSLYEYVRSASIIGTDSLGLWTVRREGEARAIAYPENSDETIADLAVQLKLTPREYRKWLMAEDGLGLPLSENEGGLGCRTFSVPNTAYLDNASYGWGPLGWWAIATSDAVEDAWTAEGLKVVDSNTWQTSRARVLSHLGDPDLYKYFFIGHGGKGILYESGNDIQPDTYTSFGIADMRLVACESWDSSRTWAKNVSRNGTIETWKGRITSFGGIRIIEPGSR